MSSLSTFRGVPERDGANSATATSETLESRFWTTMVIVAFFFYFLLTPGDQDQVRA
ncbi:MAG: hypothetical protein WDO72_09765 [Pseudomonadota bacterium]